MHVSLSPRCVQQLPRRRADLGEIVRVEEVSRLFFRGSSDLARERDVRSGALAAETVPEAVDAVKDQDDGFATVNTGTERFVCDERQRVLAFELVY